MSFYYLIIIMALLIGIIGICAMTLLFPAIARGIAYFRVKSLGFRGRSISATIQKVRRVTVLIPAHNEELTLHKTLESILGAVRKLQEVKPEILVNVMVGLDGCTDRTIEIARSCGVKMHENSAPKGKWQMLCQLLEVPLSSHGSSHGNEIGEIKINEHERSAGDWVVLADSGIIWSQDFLVKCLPFWEQTDLVGVAPAYRNPTAGFIERLSWIVESQLKTLENAVGGPISVHGATVSYRRKELTEALIKLNRINVGWGGWLNDDLVIPLYLRLTQPEQNVLYVPSLQVWDSPASQLAGRSRNVNNEFNRRRRILIGNLQWITRFLGAHRKVSQGTHLQYLLKQNPVAVLIALRRVVRVVWVYWILALVLAVTLAIGFTKFLFLIVTVALGSILIFGVKPFRQLTQTALVSLLTPYYLLIPNEHSLRWK